MSLRIVIVGAGVAGLATALACAQAGAQVHVLEAMVGVPRVPAHVDLVPSLLRDLARLGAAEDSVRRGFAYNELAVVDEHGAEGLRLPTPRLVGPQLPPAAGIALDDLLAVLTDAVVRSGATLQRGCEVHAIEPEAARVQAGGQVFEADLVVLATGAESPLVASLFGPMHGGERHAWWHALMPRPAGLDRSTWMAGSLGRRLLLVPIGMSRAGVAVVRTAACDGPADGRALARLLGSWGALPRRIARMIEPTAPTALRHVASALREPPWHRGAVLCVGAAAHTMAPSFGQAAAQALEDAVVLGELVAAGLERAELPPRFMDRRAQRVQRLHTLTERAAHWMLHPEPSTNLVQLAGEIGALVAQPP